MNDDDKQFLTKWGGKCWNPRSGLVTIPIIRKDNALWHLDKMYPPDTLIPRKCPVCGLHHLNSNFDTWDDFGWLWEKVTEKGLLDDLIWDMCLSSEHYNNMYEWIGWEYKSPAERCQLICDFLREQEEQ